MATSSVVVQNLKSVGRPRSNGGIIYQLPDKNHDKILFIYR